MKLLVSCQLDIVRQVTLNLFQITVDVKEFEMKRDDIQIFPNPASDRLNISFQNAPCGMYVIELVGVNGQVLYSELHDDSTISNGFQINVKGFRSGQYVLRMVYGNRTESRKVMIK